MIYLSTMIKNNNFPYLKEISLLSNNIKDTGFIQLIYLMKYHFLKNLQTLYVSDNALHDESIQQFVCEIQKGCIAPSAELYIGCNKLADEALHSLVSLLLSNSSNTPLLKYVILEKSMILNFELSFVEKHEIPETLLQHVYQFYTYICLLTNKRSSN